MARRPRASSDGGETAATTTTSTEAELTPAAERALIQGCYARVFEFEEMIAEKLAEHVDPLKEGRRKAWQTLKGETGITLRRLKHGYAKYKDAREALALDDETDRVRILHDIRRVNAATGGGDQMSFLADLLGSELAATAPSVPHVDEDAHDLHDPGAAHPEDDGGEAFEQADDRPRHLREKHEQRAAEELAHAAE